MDCSLPQDIHEEYFKTHERMGIKPLSEHAMLQHLSIFNFIVNLPRCIFDSIEETCRVYKYGYKRLNKNTLVYIHPEIITSTMKKIVLLLIIFQLAINVQAQQRDAMPDNDAYYCSELIQVAFGDLFESKPMNWRDADGQLPEYWVKHFEKLGSPVLEGVPGTNPTDMSRSPLLKRLQ